ncbi:MAG: class I SAM-dependent methyltransferase, partial [Deinococcota bacterium]
MVTKSYDHLAHLYQWLEYLAFGRLLHDVREHAVDAVLSKVQPHQHILILGEGDGRFLELFTHKCQFPCRVTCVDKSAQMLAKVQARLQPTSLVDVNLVQADATQTSFDASHYDV